MEQMEVEIPHQRLTRAYQVLNNRDEAGIWGNVFTIVSVVVILISVFSVILETVHTLYEDYTMVFSIVEIISVAFFTIEYILRIWSIISDPKYTQSIRGRLKYMISPLGLIDLLGFLPFYTFLIFQFNIQIFRILRLLRLLLLIKLARYSESFEIIWSAIKNKREPLSMTLITGLMLLFFLSYILYWTEHDAQPDKFPNLFTTMYIAGITLASVGYGEIVPITILGKLLTGIIIFIGIGLFILPSNIIGAGFVEEMQKRYPKLEKCPNCEKHIEESQVLSEPRKKPRKKKTSKKSSKSKTAVAPEIIKPPNFIQKTQKGLYNLLENKFPTTWPPKLVTGILMSFILISVLLIMLETNEELYVPNQILLNQIEFITTIVFTIEYILRLWMCPASEKSEFQSSILGRLRYFISPIALIDLFSILPLYLPMIFNIDPQYIWMINLFRIFRIFKVGHFSPALETLWNVFKQRRQELIVAMFLGGVILIFTSTIMFYAENSLQPDKFSSIPATLWWGIATLATVGYGDMYPLSTLGRLVSVLTAFIGVGIFTLPAVFLGSAFIDTLKYRRQTRFCPFCDANLNQPAKKTKIIRSEVIQDKKEILKKAE
jgi:voltage-gated potassium channel